VTLLVAAFGLPLVHLRHERTTPHGGDILLGRAIIIGAVLLAVLGFRWSQGLAEAIATVAVAVMGIGATLLSHGRSLQRQTTSG
jgi:hypothetical protein